MDTPRAWKIAGFTRISGIARDEPRFSLSRRGGLSHSVRKRVSTCWSRCARGSLNSTLVSDASSNPITQEAVGSVVEAALAAIDAAPDLTALKRVRAEHLAEGSAIASLNAAMRAVPKESKKEAGQLIGQARTRVNGAFAERESELAAAEASERLAAEAVDVTVARPARATGARHPLTVLQDRVSDIFVGMGWEIAEGPELESEWFNFDSLNFDADHPARAMQDTFFVEPADRHLVLRTHTSPVQMRSLVERGVPLYVLAPGRTYRTDELDATHTPVFTQFEGIAIDKGLTMAHLRGTLEHFATSMFGEEARIRLRNNYFPFTEPSAEMDIWHPGAKGGPRWIEWGGCGMVHPNVLLAAGVDPEEYQGFAFGMGVERTLMFRNALTDMRDMVEGDVRFSTQFGMVI
ncbi:phenylalanine--tRNA ligase subunit alpha [Pseudoclavibacter sp. VKM Ac-2867]|nr:phenylalanine--tRNA ligase subunit alpha [Pseudoclavibacter sp. VKM Ac-2867]